MRSDKIHQVLRIRGFRTWFNRDAYRIDYHVRIEIDGRELAKITNEASLLMLLEQKKKEAIEQLDLKMYKGC